MAKSLAWILRSVGGGEESSQCESFQLDQLRRSSNVHLCIHARLSMGIMQNARKKLQLVLH